MEDKEADQVQYNKAFLEWIEALSKEQRQQSEQLAELIKVTKGVRSVTNFFFVLALLAIALQACAVLSF